MRLLLLKLSSMGDVIHTLPALTAAKRHLPQLTVDWMVEPLFSAIPRWHPGVDRVIEMPWRASRSHPLQWGKLWHALQLLREHTYDAVLDAQGLWKSACWAHLARTHSRKSLHGFSQSVLREKGVGYTYAVGHAVPRQQHAILRQMHLWARALGYPAPDSTWDPLQGPAPDHGIRSYFTYHASQATPTQPTVVCIHSTSWPSKLWPTAHWHQLCRKAIASGWRIALLSGTRTEYARAVAIAGTANADAPLHGTHHQAHAGYAEAVPPETLETVAWRLSSAQAVVTVDTGLGHLATALHIPTIALYGATSPLLTGIWGADLCLPAQKLACVPCLKTTCARAVSDPQQAVCMQDIAPHTVFKKLEKILVPLQK